MIGWVVGRVVYWTERPQRRRPPANPTRLQPLPCRAPMTRQGEDDPSAQRPLESYASLCLPKPPAGLVRFDWIVLICLDGLGGYGLQEPWPALAAVLYWPPDDGAWAHGRPHFH